MLGRALRVHTTLRGTKEIPLEIKQNTYTDDNDSCSIPAQTFSKPDRANNEINFDAIAAQLSLSQTPDVPVSCGQQQETIQIYNSEEIQTVIVNQGAIMEQLVTVVEHKKKLVLNWRKQKPQYLRSKRDQLILSL
ncbi:unnamed protein product [Euphydryas editha]|uniref:Uncharacterized protein n=1 Tax=Euphydryas editha TaxID=104508 RepID=A0AAU9UPW6_EUPED|nr:unnamed protein product [Euphydryas editha]